MQVNFILLARFAKKTTGIYYVIIFKNVEILNSCMFV